MKLLPHLKFTYLPSLTPSRRRRCGLQSRALEISLCVIPSVSLVEVSPSVYLNKCSPVYPSIGQVATLPEGETSTNETEGITQRDISSALDCNPQRRRREGVR